MSTQRILVSNLAISSIHILITSVDETHLSGPRFEYEQFSEANVASVHNRSV